MFTHRFLGSPRGKHSNSQGSDYGQLILSVLSTEREIRSDERLTLETSALKLYQPSYAAFVLSLLTSPN